MQLPEYLRTRLLAWAERRMLAKPNRVIGQDYLTRWHVIPRNPLFNVYLHEFRGSDDDRALHDHPWINCSIILDGWYMEYVPADDDHPSGPAVPMFRDTGTVTARGGRSAHRIVLQARRAVTLFITGPRLREWGFWCPKIGWRHWRVFTDPRDSGRTGRGCD